jgi:chromosomal replication initiation ATPase DnaA
MYGSGHTMERIGELLGGRTHATVHHAINNVDGIPELRKKYYKVLDNIGN